MKQKNNIKNFTIHKLLLIMIDINIIEYFK